MKKFVIIDGHAIIHRAYHAIPPLTVADGTMVNAVYGFTSMLLKVLGDLQPDYIAVSFDVAGGTFRDDVYEDYKATRERADDDLYDQIPLIYDVVNAFNIPIYTKEGFEADDIIGTLTELVKSKKENVKSIVVSGDKDLLQLVDDGGTEVYLLKKGMSDFDLYNEEKVKEKFGFGPEMVVDFKALRGDSSDNIPGVRGIGEKGGTELIQKIGGIDEIYEQLKIDDSRLKTEFKPGIIKKLEAGKDDAYMSKELAIILRDVKGLKFDLKKCVTQEFDRDEISELLRKFEFYSLVKRIPGAGGEDVRKAKATKGTKKVAQKKLVVADRSNRDSIIDVLKNTDIIAVKEILDGDDVITSNLLGLVFVTSDASYYIEKPGSDVFEIFADDKKIIIGHDLKQLVKVVKSQKSKVNSQLFDIMIASYLINSSTRAHDLPAIALRELGEEVAPATKQATLFGIDPHVVADELSLVYRVYENYRKKIADIDEKKVFADIEMKLLPVLAEMELHGIALDTSFLEKLSIEVHKDIARIEKNIYKEAGEEFNVSSSVQLRDILFETLELPTDMIKKGKTGYSTAASELEKLREFHPIISHIEEYRELEKLRNTYIDVLPTLINKKTGRIHTTFNQAVAATGRLSSTDPNLQNIPIRTELGRRVREAFVAEKGNVLIAADYSQIELRIVASLADDKKMIDVFTRGEDIHTATAAVINNVSIDDVTKDMRRAAKEVNFGVLYGMGAFGLASRTGISQAEAKEFIASYFEGFSGVKKYLDTTLKKAEEDGYVETLFGRRRYIPELLSKNYQLRNAGERMAINMPVQGTAADIMKLAMIQTQDTIHESRYKNDVKMLLQVHDEIVLEVKKEIAQEVAELVKKEMESVVTLKVPIDVGVDIGVSWGKLK